MSGGGTLTRKLTTQPRKWVERGTRFLIDDGDGGGDGGRRRGLEERRDLSSKKLLFAIHFLRFEAHLSRALFGGRF